MTPMRSVGWIAAGAVVALAITWFWSRTGDDPSSPAREAQTEVPAVVKQAPSATAVEQIATAPVDAPAAGAQEQRRAEEAKKISDAYERGVAPTFVEYLVSKGASREDSERIVADAMREMASCVRDAMPEQPASLALPPGSPPVAASGTLVLFNDRVASCMTAVHDRIGVPPAVTYELNLRDAGVEFAARVIAVQ